MSVKKICLNNYFTKFISLLFWIFPKNILTISKSYNNLEVYIKKSLFLGFLLVLKYSVYFQLKILSDIIVFDVLNLNYRFFISYLFLSPVYNFRIYINLYINKVYLPSIVFLYNSAAWLEREIWDLFGVLFNYTFNLRRILNDYGFLGYPLRKDFPMTGFFELFYNDCDKRILYVPVQLSQDYRVFFFESTNLI